MSKLVAAAPSSSAPPAEPVLPSDACLRNAVKIAMTEDKPVLLDYWLDSMKSGEGAVYIGVRKSEDGDEKILLRSEDEYTSCIRKIFRASPTEYIVKTENSIYIVSSKIQPRKID
jgi:hypothetical protein